MNYMQKMGIDSNTVEGIAKLLTTPCRGIPDEIGKRCEGNYSCPIQHEAKRQPCSKCMAERLLAEVPMKKIKRWETYNGDFVKAELDFRSICHKQYEENGCSNCEIKGNVGFGEWMMKEVEVEA